MINTSSPIGDLTECSGKNFVARSLSIACATSPVISIIGNAIWWSDIERVNCIGVGWYRSCAIFPVVDNVKDTH